MIKNLFGRLLIVTIFSLFISLGCEKLPTETEISERTFLKEHGIDDYGQNPMPFPETHLVKQSQTAPTPTLEFLKNYLNESPNEKYGGIASHINHMDKPEEFYSYQYFPLKFPPGIVSNADGKIRFYVYTLFTADKEQIIRRFEAIVPDHPAVPKMMNGWLLADKNNVSKTSKELPNQQKKLGTMADLSSSSETCYQYQEGEHCYTWHEETGNFGPCEIDSCSGSGDDGSGSPDWPQEPDWDDGNNNDSGGGNQTPPGGGNSDDCDETAIDGGCNDWTEEPDPCDDEDPPVHCENPCETENNHIDAKESQIIMENGFLASYGPENDPLPHDQRNEKIFIMTDENSHFNFIEIVPDDVSSCHFEASGVSIPANAVALFHTHPYAPNELITDQRCLDRRGWDVEENGYPMYLAENVSTADKILTSATGLPIYVIDTDKVRTLDPSNPDEYSDTDDRCGY
jgi:hypothetical protein